MGRGTANLRGVKRLVGVGVVLATVLAAGLLALRITPPLTPVNASNESSWQVCFTPGDDCTKAIVTTLERAQRSVLVQAYTFTSASIAKALVDAHARGVKVEVLLDKTNRSERYSSADFLGHAGIPVRIDAAHAIAHNKIMVIDGATVITGSFNFTKAAQARNAENVLLIR